ncbi:MAG: TonB-dependent receptor, partial [Caulobacterales bacterium]|nr:TonB-dependent receptor [Caulobacterales bacterium]
VRFDRRFDRARTLIGLMGAYETFQQDYLIWCGTLDPQTLLGTCRYVGAPGRVGPDPASPGVATSLITQIEQDRVTLAPFIDQTIDLSERWTLSLGGRYTYESIEGSGSGRHIFDDGTIALNNRDGAGPAEGSNRIIENRFTGRAALSYQLGERASAYASIANGYKSGGFNGEVQNNATHFQDEGLFRAETITSYEIGLKARLGPAVSFSAASFFQDYQDPQARIFVNFPLPDGSSITSNSLSNLDAASVYGVEGDISWRPNARWEMAGSLALLETDIRQGESGDGALNAAAFDGNDLPFASHVSATVSARYERPVADGVRVTAQGNAKYRSRFYLDAEGLAERRQAGYTTLDAEAGLALDRAGLELSLWGRNLLDKDYAVSGFGFIGYNTFRSAPRSYGASVRAMF